jgi:hypothetical protein
MATYRVYYLDESGHIDVGRSIECETDSDAMEAARDLLEGFAGIEVWRGERPIGRIKGYSPPLLPSEEVG